MPTLLSHLRQTVSIGLFAALFITLSVSTECCECATPATIRDLRGQAGCGPVLELPTGEWLAPSGIAWLRFDKANGRRVRVGYRPLPANGECLVGQAVEITCIMADEKQAPGSRRYGEATRPSLAGFRANTVRKGNNLAANCAGGKYGTVPGVDNCNAPPKASGTTAETAPAQ